MIKQSVTALLVTLGCHGALADEFGPALENHLTSYVASWVTDPVILVALRTANAATSGYDAARIDQMDQA
ncbi:hypothetical protein [Yoonia sp.]|uniref:hypothetical protein n=1 Tax=Yoonia sp. TaxID=2212373 RepID=UPI0025E8F43A|nr:hypothetical protein [Yoonia sp.]